MDKLILFVKFASLLPFLTIINLMQIHISYNYNKIVELQPDMVFAEYRMSDMNGIELIKKSREKLEKNTPMFNIIGENIPFEELEKSSNDIGDNVNALLKNDDKDKIIKILKEYKEYKEFMNID